MNRFYIIRDRVNGKFCHIYADFVKLRNLYADDFSRLLIKQTFAEASMHFGKLVECGADMDRFEIVSIFEAELSLLKFD